MAALLFCAQPAAAQLVLPGAQPPTPTGARQARPATPRPAAPRLPGEADLVGKVFQLNGNSGRLAVERVAKTRLAARLTLEGTMISAPADACVVQLGAADPVPLSRVGQPVGVTRYQLEAPVCTLLIDVLGDAVLAVGPAQACLFREADCRADPRGLWGPDAGDLGGRLKEIERERARAETAMRDTVRQLLARTASGETRALAAEQAAFSSERDTQCRAYVSENAHGFCAAKLTQARAAALRARLAVMPKATKRK